MSMCRMRKSFPRQAERVPIRSERRRDAASAANALRRCGLGLALWKTIFIIFCIFFFKVYIRILTHSNIQVQA